MGARHGLWSAVGGKCPGWAVCGAVIAPLVCILWAGCTVTPENYKTLSMFFDGVPEPSTQVGSIDAATGRVIAAQTFVHPPYAEERCDECHKSRLSFTKNDASGCVSCHQHVPDQYAYMHGPVSAHACLWCHTPHEAVVPHLLREVDRKLCTRCHSAALLESTRVKEHADASRACLECHTGHGGSARYMLRPAPTDAAPRPAPEGGVPQPAPAEGE